MNKSPQLTIGMPVYNDVDFIEESIESILAQTFTDFILIISDDCSTDGSAEIVEEYAKKDNRIQLIKQTENLGISKNMEFLLAETNSPYFMWAGDDDIMEKTFIEKLMNALKNNSNYIAAFSTMQFIDENGDFVGKKIDYDYEHSDTKLRLKNFIKNPFDGFGYGLFRTEAIRGVNFPVWVWPNRKVSWNNIYPTLCFYLAKGNYKHVYDQPLFLKRIKTKVNHSVAQKRMRREFLAISIRKINLSFSSFSSIKNANGFRFTISIIPFLFKYFTFLPIQELFVQIIREKKSP